MTSLIPRFNEINYFEFYNLNSYGWMFENTNKAIENNTPIIQKLSENFAEYTGLPVEVVSKAFNIDYIYTRSTEPEILLYTNKGSDDVHYYFIDRNSETYRALTGK